MPNALTESTIFAPPETPWHAIHDNQCIVLSYLWEVEGYGANDLLHAHSKIWNYEAEFKKALRWVGQQHTKVRIAQ